MLIRHKSDEYFVKSGGQWCESAGAKVINFIERYLVLESGKRFELLDWQKSYIKSVYCWLNPDRSRRVRVSLLTLGRKNGKSALTFGLTMYHLIADGEVSPSCVSCACTRDQAAQIFKWCKFAIGNSPALSKNLHCTPSKKTITYPARNGTYVSLSSDSASNFGHGHTFVVHDEKAFSKDDLYTALKNSTDARRGLQIITSTAGWNKNGAFFKLVQDARKVLTGEVVDTTFQPWIFEIPEGYDEEREENWKLANPSLGLCGQSIEDFRQQWNREKRDASTRLAWTRLKFNRWTESENAWIAPESWEACQGNIPADALECHLGLDVGASRDLTAISAVFALPDKRYAVRSWGFVPEGALNTRDSVNASIYDVFRKDGSLTVLPGTATDLDRIIAFLIDLTKKYKVKSISFDKWQSLPLSSWTSKQRIPTYNFPQTHSYFHAPATEFERLVNSRKIIHDGNSLLRWQIGHTFLTRDGKGYIKPATIRPENKKDNLLALLMGLSQALQNPQSNQPSAYGSRGLFAF